ncbi:MAG: hypothetical protein RIB58_04800 [Phycisphaerales bacterium]
MRRDKKAPALYELVRERPRPGAPVAPGPTPARPEPVVEDEAAPTLHWFSPGRTVRVPMGYFFFAVGLALVVAWAAYFIGYRHAESTIDAQRRDDARSQLNQMQDPLDALRGAPVNPDLLPDDGDDLTPAGSGATSPNSGGQARPIRPGVYLVDDAGSTSDPRERGMNYFHLITTTRADALEAGSYLAENGVEVAVIAVGRNNMFVLVALKPFPPGTIGKAEYLQYRNRLESLGRIYRKDFGGVDFNSMLAVKYNG